MQYGLARASKRYHNGSPNKDLYHYLMDEAGIESERPSFKEVVIDATVGILAGSDTVSSAIPTAIWLLLRHPRVLRNLQAELSTVKGSEVVHVELASLPYLNAIINESLRLFPPVLDGSQRAPKPGSGGIMVGGNFVPEGTSAHIQTYTLQRDDRYFSHPEQFIPERWLPAGDREALHPDVFNKHTVLTHDVAAFIPFSLEVTIALARSLHYQEMRAVIYALLTKFDIKFQNGYDAAKWERELCNYFVTLKGKLPVILTVKS